MVNEGVSFGTRISRIADEISKRISSEIDMVKISRDRSYISRLQEGWLKNLLYEMAKTESLIVQIYFQFTPDVTPQLEPDEFGAGVCIENTGNWQVCEHNMSYIRDFADDNAFLKWWYFETIRVGAGGFTRAYYDPYMGIDVITYSRPVYSVNAESKGLLMGVLGIDINYEDFRKIANRKLVETIRNDIESAKKDFELVGDKNALSDKFINVDTLEIISKDRIINNLVTKSKEMEKVMDLAMKAATSDANVLLQGETGVGKDYWADFIHTRSGFCQGRLVNVNCCALAEGLAESEFFGYGKGAFTGAKGEGKAGYFEAANGGTIILNEIGDLPMHMQAKLLNVIQDKAVTRVGETLPKKISFRLIAATNKDLPRLIEEGRFREDLYYRLNVIPIQIPPLRQRKDDIFSLTYFFLSKNEEKYKTNKRLSMELLSTLINYNWPGNIRELENLIERFFATSNNAVLTEEDLPWEFKGKIAAEKEKGPGSVPSSLKEQLEEAEKKIILEKYNQCKSSYKVAKELGISQSSAYQKIKKYMPGNHGLT